ncbi:hypothetical protein F7725_020834 [Dissostichus mawsoni]|uniref:Protein YIF1 n=1 Tax=Dissostichus mawsoni TaxID=36200 RepID=A0A7J5YEB0_DISMA|nr:hypothetical protein F7725_020834 [Dissostichus mawsoni]
MIRQHQFPSRQKAQAQTTATTTMLPMVASTATHSQMVSLDTFPSSSVSEGLEQLALRLEVDVCRDVLPLYGESMKAPLTAGKCCQETKVEEPNMRMGNSSMDGTDGSQLFEDTSGVAAGPQAGYSNQQAGLQAAGFSGQSLLSDPMSNLAMAYGSSLASQGRKWWTRMDLQNGVKRLAIYKVKLDRFIPISKLKYYFAVDTVYVGKKLGLLVFPYMHENWEVSYQQDTPVAPRFDVNAPDLYIPAMAFITYVLVAGLALGTQNKFSPELLGVQASSALVWLIMEVLAVLLSLYLVTVNTDLTTIDLLAFSGYKYVGMIVGVVSGLLFGRPAYYLSLLWCCAAIFVFMIRTLRLKLLSEAAAEGRQVRGSRNQLRMYLTMSIAGAQPSSCSGSPTT